MGRTALTKYKVKLFSEFARFGRALANSRRLEIVELLSQGGRTVEELAAEVGTTTSNISQHLKVLRDAGIVESEKDGLYVHCRLASDDIALFWQTMRKTCVGLSPELRELIRMYVNDRDRLEPVQHGDLMDRVRNGRVMVIDVRPEREYAAGHIPNAISIPLDELEEKINSIPRDVDVVAYCRGPYCLLSVDAVEMLRIKGFDARRLADGLPEWRLAGHPVEGHDSTGQKS